MMHSLEQRLREAGIACSIELRDRLVVLVPDDRTTCPQRDDRLRALNLVRDAGFSHAAIELDPDVAAVSRD
jgi:hypothetical protein